jgi:hypothetical protein
VAAGRASSDILVVGSEYVVFSGYASVTIASSQGTRCTMSNCLCSMNVTMVV